MKPADILQSLLIPRREFSVAVFILLAFILINMMGATRTPTVFSDEPSYTDPAANLYFGNGFTSTMWAQGPHDFWCGNVPLYQGFLYISFKLFGFGLFQVRIVNTMLTAIGALLIWAGLRQTAFVRESGYRLLALALVLSGSVSTLTFRTGRYDSTMFFVCALVFFTCCLPTQCRGRLAWVCLSSALLLFAGIPTLPYAGLMILINLAVYGLANFSLLMSISMGLLMGVAGIIALYSHFATIRTFLEIVLPFTGIGSPGLHDGSFWHTKIFGLEPGEDSLFTSFFGYPIEFSNPKILFDYSAALLFLLAVLLSWNIWRTANAQNRRFIIWIIATVLIVPPIMHLAGHYRAYYRWMTYIPLAVAVPRLLEIQRITELAPRLRRVTFGIVGLSLFLGVPLRTLVAVPDWSRRSPRPLDQVAAQIVQPADIVICYYKTYFSIRPLTKCLYAYGLPARGDFSRITDLPANKITLLCLLPEDLETVQQIVGGKWEKIPLDGINGAGALAKSRYAVDFYRRTDSAF